MMMSDSNEFREKAEEYQVIQAAIPAHERYGASYWEMSLRGQVPPPHTHIHTHTATTTQQKLPLPPHQGARFVPVGNIFR